jgi:hypothetical protein
MPAKREAVIILEAIENNFSKKFSELPFWELIRG